MKIEINKSIFLFLVFALCLSACTNSMNQAEPPRQSDNNTNEPTTSAAGQHITRNLSEYLTIDADVIYPQKSNYISYCIERVAIGAEYTTVNRQKNLEIQDLLFRFAMSHPGSDNNSIGFMSREDAVAMGASIIENCGVSLIPELNTCVGLEHEQIMAWQQELLNDPNSYYNEFGKAVILSDLTTDDDAYYLRFTFSYDEIPVLGSDEPSVKIADASFPPVGLKAEILITPLGVQEFSITPAYAVVGEQYSGAIISVDDAIDQLKATYESVILNVHYRVSSIYLEYIPLESAGKTVLTPYWCFLLEHENIREDGTTYWSDNLEAERYNAYTGRSLAYGG